MTIDRYIQKIPKEYHEYTKKALNEIPENITTYELILKMAEIADKWFEYDEVKSKVLVDGQDFIIEFEGDCLIFTDEPYRTFKTNQDRQFFGIINKEGLLEDKILSILRVLVDYSDFVNPQDLTFDVNHVLHDGGVTVTMKDKRIVAYQKCILEIMDEVVEEHPELLFYDATLSQTTRSVYIDLHFRDRQQIRISIRDHDDTFEDDIYIIRVNSLKPRFLKKKVIKIINQYVEENM